MDKKHEVDILENKIVETKHTIKQLQYELVQGITMLEGLKNLKDN